ncbi:NAD(P)-dependent dehydrogenase (short-subunit alcohol dehydrogenase family) [Promicromonospora sp. AC04]|uniref:SDR family oxidoreductase n=1 Tax=Promicromonospora sp. AC04 TaxID=2135723 RepID=UPI000D3C70A6|nr:SDR family oxidoreductase [Promicromonospora sp. AC04]PUB25534.1 NAD(P)-dependent dehydrogenase (short-subunit alcohol dehydrogenase family) [Promicromonospora sp. AC04]
MNSTRPVLVVGASGYVGSRVARGLAADGRTVLAAARSPLPDGGDGVVPVRYDTVATLPDAVRAACARAGAPLPGAVVASIGGWHKGAPLLEADPDQWSATLASHLTAHLEAARALVPLLAPGDPYVVLNGAASREAMAGSGAISVTGAGLAMLVQVLRLEAAQPNARAVRFHELVVDHAVSGDDRNQDPAQTRTPAQVVSALGELLDQAGAPAVVHV